MECGSSMIYVFKNTCFPAKCENRIKIKTFSSDIIASKCALRQQNVSINKKCFIDIKANSI